ncbi:MAG: LOG family protein [Candidatus Omnitrophica bacterium]|nr:LOG family protein [Candidatus Omnitrophota bacterium]
MGARSRIRNSNHLQRAIGVMGSGDGIISRANRLKAQRVGAAIAKAGFILATGGCSGLPYDAARGAYEAGGFVIGISPAINYFEHVQRYHFPTKFYHLLIYSGMGFIERDVLNIRTSEAIITIAGRSGTLNEFSIAYDEGKNIGVLTKTGGVSDQIQDMAQGFVRSGKRTETQIVYDSDPEKLVQKLISSLEIKRPYWPKLR